MVARDYPQSSSMRRVSFTGKMPVVKLALPVWLYLFAVILPLSVSVGPVALSVLRIYLIIMIFPLFFKLMSGKYGKIIFTDIIFTLHILWMFVSLAINNPDRMIEQVGSSGLEFLGGYLVGRAYIRTVDDFRGLCRALVLIVLCLFPFAIWETITGYPHLLEALRSVPGTFTVERVFHEQRLGFERVQSLFAHPIHFGLFCSVGFSLCFVGLKGTLSTSSRYLLSMMLFIATLSSLSSGALLALLLQLGFIFWAFVLRNLSWRWWLFIGLLGFVYLLIDLLSNRTPIEVFMSYATFSSHNAYWRAIIFDWGMKNIYDNPIFGIGLNDWERPYYMYSGSMDNFWLVIGVRYGFPGIILLLLGYLWGLKKVTFRNFKEDPILSQLRLSWVYTFMGLTFTLCTVHVWTNIYSFAFFMFGSGMWFLSASPASKETVPEVESGSVRTKDMRYTRFAHKA